MADSKSAGEILETIVEDGREELERASLGLAFSGFAAGLNVSFGTLAVAVMATLTGGLGLASYLAYPVGFLIVILGRAQLFTENTVTPVTVVLTDRSRLMDMLRLWGVIYVSNMFGTAVFAAVAVYGNILTPEMQGFVIEYVQTKLDYGFWTTVLKAIFGGWIVALIAWMVAASRDTISQAVFIYLLAFLIPAAGLVHCVAGSSEALVSVFAGETSFYEYLFTFLVPTTLGNIVGGVVLVALLNYGQVIGSRDNMKMDEHAKKQKL